MSVPARFPRKKKDPTMPVSHTAASACSIHSGTTVFSTANATV